jgi:hypothetical protein
MMTVEPRDMEKFWELSVVRGYSVGVMASWASEGKRSGGWEPSVDIDILKEIIRCLLQRC